MFEYQKEGVPEELVFGLSAEFVNTQLKHFKAFSSLWWTQIKMNNDNKYYTTQTYKQQIDLPKSGLDTSS